MATGGKQDALKGFTEGSNVDDVLAKAELEVLCSEPRADVSADRCFKRSVVARECGDAAE